MILLEENIGINTWTMFFVVQNCSVMHVAMLGDGKLYVVAFFRFYPLGSSLILYLRNAHEGKKMDILRKKPNMYFQMDCGNEFVREAGENPAFCQRDARSEQAEFITDEAEKSQALNRFIQHLHRRKNLVLLCRNSRTPASLALCRTILPETTIDESCH